MRTALLTIGVILIGSIAWGQTIDENGRTAKERAAQVLDIQPRTSALSQKQVDASEVVISYHLPERKTTGEIRLFHPTQDQELGKYNLPSASGDVRIPLSSLVNGVGVVGLYSEGQLIDTFKLKIQ